MIFNEIKCHVNTSFGLVGGDASPLYPRLYTVFCITLNRCMQSTSFQDNVLLYALLCLFHTLFYFQNVYGQSVE